MQVSHLDLLVLTVSDIEKTVDFCEKIIRYAGGSFAGGRSALTFGKQKINLHQLGNEFEPKTGNVKEGSADLCFILNSLIEAAYKHLVEFGVEIIDGSVSRTGAIGSITSLYYRDPDQNLIEVSNYN